MKWRVINSIKLQTDGRTDRQLGLAEEKCLMCVLSKKLAPDNERVTSTGRAVEDPNGGASF